jgi:glutamate synthase (NADPH/NADH) small chain
MGKATGFLEYKRLEQRKRPVQDRIHDWSELRIPMEVEELREQGARCMNCGIPFCHGGVLINGMAAGCPVRNLIPEWNELVYLNQWEDAYHRLARTNPFPEFTARVCPAPCEGSCTEGYIMEPVAVNCLEYAIIERAFKEGWVKAKKTERTGKKIAIVGSGPSGLSAAYYLNAVGHEVTIYERNDRAGGLLMYGIPGMKLEKKVVERRLSILRESGIQFVLGTEVGKDLKAQQLIDGYDAVLLCCGATNGRNLEVPGNHLKGMYLAMDFLKSNTKSLLDSQHKDNQYISAKGKNVIIIGGGDTGTDCVGTAIRHGCKSITQFEILPKPPTSRQHEKNPWPEWPLKLKTDYGQEEAISLYEQDPRQFCISTKCVKGNDKGEVCEIDTVEVIWSKDPSGRVIPVEIVGSSKSWKADLIIVAMGFVGPEATIPEELGLERDGRSNIKADYNHFETNRDKVFAAGDMRRGQSLVVWALQEGKLSAAAVDKYLTGKSIIR